MLLVAIVATTSVMAQLNPMQPIPADKDVRTGRLENGMTYYIRHNEKPKNQADFYILHNVGAIQENDDQQGLAHFLEHMAFNGTKNLPGKMVIEYLEKIGVKFGANLNAGTAWDQTVYNISDVPTVREGIVDSALLILHDWSHFISLVPEEIDSERGVISEELRTRDGANWRSTMSMIRAIGKGSKYEQRNLIGYLDYLKSFPHDALRKFYETWYRPDYQAIIVVGDVDVDQVEAKIKNLMSDIPAPAADAPQKEAYTVPDNEEPIISIFTDPEMQNSTIQYYIKRPAMPAQANNLVYKEMIDVMTAYITTMENARLQEIAMKPDAPFIGAGMGDGSIGIIPTMEATSFYVQTQEGKLAEGFKALYTEMEKIRRHGFTESEFERAQENLMRSTERKYTNRNDRTNNEYVQVYLDNYQKNTPMPDAETEWQLDSLLIKSLSVDDVNALAKELINPKNQVIVVNAPKKENLVNPTEEEMLAVMAEVNASDIEAYEDNAVKEPLIAETVVLKGSPVKKTAQNEVFGATEWTLKNGVKVIVKPSTLKADEVRLSAKSLGGASLLSDEDYFTGQLLPAIAAMSGVSKFSATDLRKQLSGKTASVNLSVDDYANGLEGYASPKDLETMLQLLYLNFTQPRFSEDDFNTMVKMYKSYVENMTSNPDYIAQEELIKTIYNDNPRRQQLSVELLDGLQYAHLPAIFQTLYPGANSFTFTIVGNVDPETIKPLVEKYIGSLPVSKKTLSYADDNVRPVQGKVENDFTTPMQQPKVSINFYFSGNEDYSIENKMKMTFLTQALNSRYLQSIREEKGGTYGVQLMGSHDRIPVETYDMHIFFDTNEEMADELDEIIMDEIREIAANGPRTEDVEKTREFLAKNWKNTLEQNAGWMNYLDQYYFDGLDYISNYEKVLASITNEDIQQLAKKILDDGNLVHVVMRPATAETPAE